MTGNKWLKFLGLAVLIGISIFAFMRYYALLDQNRILQKLVRSYERKLSELELAKKAMEERLTQEKEVLGQELKDAQEQLVEVNEELKLVKDKAGNLEKANLNLLAERKQFGERIGSITKEKKVIEDRAGNLEKANLDLLAERQQLEERIGSITKEKEVLEAKFNSLDELKKAIRDLKVKLRRGGFTGRKQLQQHKEIEGNRGYLTFRGEGTSVGKVKIEVIPVP